MLMVPDEYTPWDRFPELTALSRYRLERDLTYRQLGETIGIPYRTLHHLLTSSSARPYDRTLFRIRTFLRRVAQASPAKPRRRRKAVA